MYLMNKNKNMRKKGIRWWIKKKKKKREEILYIYNIIIFLF
jgi:hypothetical protein